MGYETVNIIATIVAVVVSAAALIFTVLETRRSRAARQVDLIMELDKRFDDQQDGVPKRRTASAFLLEHRGLPPRDPMWANIDDVIDRFQTLGTFARSGHADTMLIYKFFYPWISRYWFASRDYIAVVRSDNPLIWDDAEWLYKQLGVLEVKCNAGRRCTPTAEDMNQFFEGERDL